jgi:hypothetical protein
VTYRLDGAEPVDLWFRAGTAGLVPFPSEHNLAVVPAGATTGGWERFGDGVPTESAEFDALYRVHARHPGWALIVLNPALMQRLIDHRPLALVIAGDLLAVIRPGWVPAPALPDFQRFTEQLAFSAQGARADHPVERGSSSTQSAARLSGWSTWPPKPGRRA